MGNSPARSGVDVGSIIAGTYTIEALIGRGGMGEVFLASHTRLPGKKVAIKLLHVDLQNDDVIARFRREALIASELDHPNIVRVDDYNVSEDGTPYLILEYLQGESLAQRIAKGPIPLDTVMTIIRQVGSAVAAAHRAGIVHRDLKPQNIFLVATEVDGRVVEIAKVLDFGISKIRGSDTVKTQESSLLGTPQYMAPEQATGQHTAVDERTDVFALGAIVYEMLCGQSAFSGLSIPEVVFKVVYEEPPPLVDRAPSVPPAIVTAVRRAMAKPANDRFPSVSAFVEALTGTPLALPRSTTTAMSEVGRTPSSGSRHAPVAGNAAFANTVGSGDHGASLQAAGQASTSAAAPREPEMEGPGFTPGPEIDDGRGRTERGPAVPVQPRRPADPAPVTPTANAPVATHALTVDSMSGALRPPLPAPAALAAPAAPIVPPARNTGWIAALAVAVVMVGAIAFYLLKQPEPAKPGGPEASPVASAGDVVAPLDAQRVPTDPDRIVAVEDAAVASGPVDGGVAATPADAAVVAIRPKPPKPPTGVKKPGDFDETGDPGLVEKLRAADRAFDGKQWTVARDLVNQVIDSPLATPRQLSRAHALHGAYECRVKNSQGGAKADLRSIKLPRWRAWLIEYCGKLNYKLR